MSIIIRSQNYCTSNVPNFQPNFGHLSPVFQPPLHRWLMYVVISRPHFLQQKHCTSNLRNFHNKYKNPKRDFRNKYKNQKRFIRSRNWCKKCTSNFPNLLNTHQRSLPYLSYRWNAISRQRAIWYWPLCNMRVSQFSRGGYYNRLPPWESLPFHCCFPSSPWRRQQRMQPPTWHRR